MPEIEWLYRSRLVQFVRVARAIVSDEQLALDAVQEAFTRAVEKRRTFRRSGSIDAWLWRIVVNEARKRTARRGQHVVEDASLPNDAKAPVDVEVRAAVAALPERQRLAVFLRYYADLDYAAIAVVLGVERGTVSATLSAAHRNLAKGLQEAVL